jgi:multidrug efflux pump subunit AcrA (membrane-fusion protein)
LAILSDTNKKYSWHGHLTGVEGNIDPRNRLTYVLAQVEYPYAKDDLQPNRPPLSSGSFVEAMIQGREHTNIVVLPRDAVHNRNEVWILNDEDRITIRKVSVLYRGKDSIYVNKGLNRDDRVITTPLEVVVENMRVHVTGAQDSPVSPIDEANQQPELDDPLYIDPDPNDDTNNTAE